MALQRLFNYFFFLGSLVTSLLSVAVGIVIESDWRMDRNLNNKLFDGPVIEGSVSSIFSCIVKCLDTDEACSVVTYVKDTGSCRGHVTYNSSQYTVSSGSITWTRDMIPFFTKKCEPYILHIGSTLCFDVRNATKNWMDAKNTCNDEGGDLIVLDTSTKRSFLNNLLTTSGGTRWLYVGAHDRDVENVWNWINGKQVGQVSWANGEPNGDSLENCGFLMENTGTLLYDVDCGRLLNFICEKNIWPE